MATETVGSKAEVDESEDEQEAPGPNDDVNMKKA